VPNCRTGNFVDMERLLGRIAGDERSLLSAILVPMRTIIWPKAGGLDTRE
jgi:hypothetical protein